jgi:hypothetical protein
MAAGFPATNEYRPQRSERSTLSSKTPGPSPASAGKTPTGVETSASSSVHTGASAPADARASNASRLGSTFSAVHLPVSGGTGKGEPRGSARGSRVVRIVERGCRTLDPSGPGPDQRSNAHVVSMVAPPGRARQRRCVVAPVLDAKSSRRLGSRRLSGEPTRAPFRAPQGRSGRTRGRGLHPYSASSWSSAQ